MCTDHHMVAAASSSCDGHAQKKSNKQKPEKFDTRLRNFFIGTNIDLFIIGLAFAYHAQILLVNAAEEEENRSDPSSNADHTVEGEESDLSPHSSTGAPEHETQETEIRSTYAILFPWFAQILGVFAYFLLSRYAHALPYTAVMFIIGLIIGIAEYRHDSNNAIHESTASWLTLNGELILLIFLPGLLYLESYNIDIHLFIKSFGQILVMAFPM